MSESNENIKRWVVAGLLATGALWFAFSIRETLKRCRNKHFQLILNKDIAQSQRFNELLIACEKNSLTFSKISNDLLKNASPKINDFLGKNSAQLLNSLSKNIDLLVLAEECGSTQTEIDKYSSLNQKRLINTLFISLGQTQGKGRNQNTWISIPGNIFLTLSYNYKKKVTPLKMGIILLGSITKVLSKFTLKEDIQIKWPNDIYVGEYKICGILSESSPTEDPDFQLLKSGIGLNIESRSGFKGLKEFLVLKEKDDLRAELILLIIEEFFKNIADCENQENFENILKYVFELLTVKGTNMRIIDLESKREREFRIMGIDPETLYLVGEDENGKRWVIFPSGLHLANGCEARLRSLK